MNAYYSFIYTSIAIAVDLCRSMTPFNWEISSTNEETK